MSVGCIDCKWYYQQLIFDTPTSYYHSMPVNKLMWSVFRCCIYPTKCRKLDDIHALEHPAWCPISNGGKS